MQLIENTNCVQCGEHFRYKGIKEVSDFRWIPHLPFCTNPKCHNYGLLQATHLPMEVSTSVSQADINYDENKNM